MEQTNMGVHPLNHFAVKLEHQAQNAVRSRVLRPEIDVELTNLGFRHQGHISLGRDHSRQRGHVISHDLTPSPFRRLEGHIVRLPMG